jgi:hypothetical protein
MGHACLVLGNQPMAGALNSTARQSPESPVRLGVAGRSVLDALHQAFSQMAASSVPRLCNVWLVTHH